MSLMLADLTGHKGIISLIDLNGVRKYNFTDYRLFPVCHVILSDAI